MKTVNTICNNIITFLEYFRMISLIISVFQTQAYKWTIGTLKNCYYLINACQWMHAHKFDLQTSYPLPRIASLGLHWNKGEFFETGNLSAPISPLLTHWCGQCDYTLPFGSMVVVLLTTRWWHWPAWIIFFFRCWVANDKHREMGGEVQHWVLANVECAVFSFENSK